MLVEVLVESLGMFIPVIVILAMAFVIIAIGALFNAVKS